MNSFSRCATALVCSGLAFPALSALAQESEGTPPIESPPAAGASAPGDPATTEKPEGEAGDGEGEEEDKPGLYLTFEVDLATSYVWRGEILSTDAFEPVIQPSITASYVGLGPGSLTVGTWLNRGLTEASNELDFWLEYETTVGIVTAKLGYALYLRFESDPIHEHDFSGRFEFDVGVPIVPFLFVGADPITSKGFYACVGLKNTSKLGDLEIETVADFGVDYYDPDVIPDNDFGAKEVTLQTTGRIPIGEAGLSTGLMLGGSYNFRAEELYPFAMLILAFDIGPM